MAGSDGIEAHSLWMIKYFRMYESEWKRYNPRNLEDGSTEGISTESRSQIISLFDTHISSMAQLGALHASRVRCTSARVGPMIAGEPCRSAPPKCRHAADARLCGLVNEERVGLPYDEPSCCARSSSMYMYRDSLLSGRSSPSLICFHTCRALGPRRHGSTVHVTGSCSKPAAALSLCRVCAHHHQSATSSHLPLLPRRSTFN